MAAVTIRNLSDEAHRALKVRAARHNRSTEAEMRAPPSRCASSDPARLPARLEAVVVSEAMKPQPHPAVRDWLDAQAAETLFLCSVTIAEVMFGIGALPRGKRKERRGPSNEAFQHPTAT